MIRQSFKNPFVILVFALIVALIAVVSVSRLAVDILPQFKTSAVQVLTLYPGMPAEVIEKDITSRIERWTGQSEGIVRQESKSIIGASIVRDHFRDDIDPNTAMSHVTSYAMSDQYYLPPGTLPPMVMPYDPTASIPLCLLAVSSETKTGKELYDLSYFNLRNMLGGIQGIVAPAVYGGKLRRIYIYLEPDKLEARNLSATDVMNAIQKSSTMIPTGFANIGDINYNVNAGGLIKDIADFNKIVIKYEGKAPVFVQDVGYAKDAGAIQTNIVRINGRKQVYVPIYKRPGANTIESVNRVKDALSTLKKRLPSDVNLDVIFDQSSYVRNAINGLVNAGIAGIVLVILVLLLFLGNVRSALAVVISLPLSVMFAFIALYFTGESINSMTLGGLALALGLLVDNSIVVLENTDRLLKLGNPPRKAAFAAAREVATPVLVSTLVVIIVFFPVVFLTGVAKYLFTSLAYSVTFAMIGSYIFSLTLIPVIAAFLFRNYLPDGSKERKKSGFERLFERFKAWYGRILAAILRFRIPVLGGVVFLFIATLFATKGLGYELFPKMDVGQLEIYARLEPGTRLEKTDEEIGRIEEVLKEEVGDQMKMMVSNMGVFYDWPAAYTPNSGSQDAFIKIQLHPGHESIFGLASRLRIRLTNSFPGVEFAINTGGIVTAALNYGLPAPIDIQIKGNDLFVANGLARRVRDAIRGIEGTRDVRIIQRMDQPQLDIGIDRTKAAEMGVHAVDAVKNIVSSLNSSTTFAKSFWIDERNGNHYFVGVTYPEHLIDNESSLGNVGVNSETSEKTIPVRNFTKLKHTTAPAEVNHHNLTRVTDVHVNVEGRDIGSVSTEIEKRIEVIRKEMEAEGIKGYEIAIRGEIEQMNESFAGMGIGLLLAILLVYLIIVPLFRSWVQPLIIIIAVPLGLIGVVWMLLFTGTYVSIQSIMGVIMMVGISVAYGNLLIDRINVLVNMGVPVREAILEGSSDRLRPVLMTMLTTVLGLTPMALGLQTGGEANVPLARAIIGGVLAATFLTLVVIPILYSFLGRKEKDESEDMDDLDGPLKGQPS